MKKAKRLKRHTSNIKRKNEPKNNVSQFGRYVDLPIDPELFNKYFLELKWDQKLEILKYYTTDERIAVRDIMIVNTDLRGYETEEELEDLSKFMEGLNKEFILSDVKYFSNPEYREVEIMRLFALNVYHHKDCVNLIIKQGKASAEHYFSWTYDLHSFMNIALPTGFDDFEKKVMSHWELKILK